MFHEVATYLKVGGPKFNMTSFYSRNDIYRSTIFVHTIYTRFVSDSQQNSLTGAELGPIRKMGVGLDSTTHLCYNEGGFECLNFRNVA